MLDRAIKQWDKNREYIKEQLKTRIGNKDHFKNYFELVKFTMKNIMNHNVDDKKYDIKHITQINNGDYSGTLIYIIPEAIYEPDIWQYLVTFVDYGSCSGGDTLIKLKEDYKYEDSINDYMILCKDIITNLKPLYESPYNPIN